MNRPLSRRALLRGTGVAIGLPWLEALCSLPASGRTHQKPPVRLAYLYIPNGVAAGAWEPKIAEGGRLQQLNPWMASLQPFCDDLILLKNFWTPRGNGHGAGTATWLTGGGFDGERIDVGGSSVDQIAARRLADQTLLPSLELSLRGEGMFSSNLPRNTISWVDQKTPAPRDVEPRVIFDRMFRSGRPSSAERSVLDTVLDDARRMRARVSQADRRKIEEYLESIRAIERRIQFADLQRQRAAQIPGLQQALVRPAAEIPTDHSAYVRCMLDMMVLAFWSDATRVCTFMMDHGQSNRYFNFIPGVQGTWHALSHWKDISGRTEDDDGVTSWSSRTQKREMYNRVTAWHTEHVAYLLQRLQSISEHDGNLLQNSMVVYGSSLGDGHEHTERHLPVLVAGQGGGAIRTGRVLGGRRPTSLSDLHLAMLQGLGIPQQQFAESRQPLALA